MFTLIVALTVKDKQDVAKVGELLTQAAKANFVHVMSRFEVIVPVRDACR